MPGRNGQHENRAMRIEGRLATRDDSRGSGFVEPRQGGAEVFVHV
jgi:cold shock CspA family protein